MRQRHAAPAIAWVIAAILVVAPYLAGSRLAPDVDGQLLAIDRLDRLRNSGVVFIGSSLTACAVPFDRQFEAAAASAGLRLEFVRITTANATQEDFAAVLDRIRQSRARLILIEAEMLLRQPYGWQRRAGVTGLAYAYQAQLRALRVRMGIRGQKSANTGVRDCNLLDQGATPEDMDRVASRPRAVRTDPWVPGFRQMIQTAGSSGKRIVVVALGRAAGLEARLDPAYRKRFGLALRELQAEPQIRVWVFPAATLPDQAYSDGAHLREPGRIAFTAWLIRQLAADRAGN